MQLLRIWRKSLLFQLVSYFLLISLVTVALVGYLAYYSARQTLTQALYDQLEGEATAKNDELNRWVEDARQNLLLIAQSPELQSQIAILLLLRGSNLDAAAAQSAYDYLTQYFIAAITAKPDLEELFLLSDYRGEVFFSTDKAHEGEIHITDPYFSGGQTQAFIQGLYTSPTTHKPAITIAVPMLDKNNFRVGVLAAHLNLTRMDRIILQRAGLKGETYVVDAQGNFVSADRFGRPNMNYITTTVGIQAAITGANGQGLYTNYKGDPVVGVYLWNPERKLALLAELNQAEAFAPASRLGLTILVVGLITAGVMAAGVLLLALQVTRPILAITRAAQQVAGGQLNVEAPVLTENEVGTLARTFNQMTSQVRRLYEELKHNEAHFRSLIENASDIITLHQPDGLVTYASPSIQSTFGYTPEEVTGQNITRFIHPEDAAKVAAVLQQAVAHPDQTPSAIFRFQHKNRLWRRVETQGHSLIEAGQMAGIVFNSRDVTEREQHGREQEAIVAIASALRTAQTRTEIFPIILDEALELLDAEGSALALRDPATDKTVVELGRGGWAKLTGLRIPPGKGVSGQVIATGQPYVTNDARSDPNQFRADLFGAIKAVACVPLIARDEIIGALWVGRTADVGETEVRLLTAVADIAASAIHRTTLNEQTDLRLQRLSALRTIDAAITASQDLPATLYTILEQTSTHLGIDATAILLYKRFSHTLEYAASRGFRGNVITATRLRLGESHAGRAAQERRMVRVLDLAEPPRDSVRAPLVNAENFVSYYGVPLVSKGQVKGILEIFNRARLTPDPEWEAFLEALAGEAAIAIDNASLFEDLQRANVDLAQAYDATIEGWSRTLEIRDRTPGHTQRVTDLTIGLAQALGISETEMIHLRRGAILHDIGKMSMPDAILVKPEPLSSEDMEIMKHHPENAYKMLSAIPYLRDALEIPYCHHEHWDGSGYPRGLVADQIPRTARIFAVVDLWDELRYRRSLPEDQVRERIQTLAGLHLDPEIVDVFLKLEII